jgi:surfeit locus 1 family protein
MLCAVYPDSIRFHSNPGLFCYRMRIANFEFKPALWPSMAALVLIPFLSSLGVWQLNQASEKEQRLQDYAQRDKTGLVLTDSSAVFEQHSGYKQVQIKGHYLVNRSFLLDNQIHQSAVGYHVFTPLQLDDKRLILVNRGWIAMGASRDALPAIPTPEDEVTISGVLSPPPGYGLLLGDDIQTNTLWPRVVQAVVLTRLATELNTELAPQIILLDPNAADGFVRQWKIVKFGPEKNLGYAFQWFMMALAVLIIFIVVNTRRINSAGEAGES